VLPVEVGVAMAPMAGQAELADHHLVLTRDGEVLVAVLDGVGHGEPAQHAAAEASSAIREAPLDSLESLVARCHERLRTTRGVAMSLARLDLQRGRLTWLGVGNVAGVVFRNGFGAHARGPQREFLVLRSGVVGNRLPHLRSEALQLADGDTVVFATDGIASDFDRGHGLDGTPQVAADRILEKYGKGTDDALVLVMRYRAEVQA
jgi:serine phosphatase RsbU (regulator of sigma subunit)